jgi:hypothetical protein
MIVDPFKSVGDLFFNDSRPVIRKKINEPFISGIKGDEDDEIKDYYDYFEKMELFVYYDKDDKINAFEFFKPSPVFKGVNLLLERFDNLIKFFFEIDPDLISDSSSEFRSNKFGIGANVSDDSEAETAIPEAVIIFRKGYYDQVDLYIERLSIGL